MKEPTCIAWLKVIVCALAGPLLGVACYQAGYGLLFGYARDRVAAGYDRLARGYEDAERKQPILLSTTVPDACLRTVASVLTEPTGQSVAYFLAVVPDVVNDGAFRVIACEPLPSGTQLVTLKGRQLPTLQSMCQWRIRAYANNLKAARHVIRTGNSFLDVAMEPAFHANWGLYIKPPRGAGSNLKEANTKLSLRDDGPSVSTARSIAAGEELTIDLQDFGTGGMCTEPGRNEHEASVSPCAADRVIKTVLTTPLSGRAFKLAIVPMPLLEASAPADGQPADVPPVGVIACENIPANTSLGVYRGKKMRDGPEYEGWLEYLYPRAKAPRFVSEIEEPESPWLVQLGLEALGLPVAAIAGRFGTLREATGFRRERSPATKVTLVDGAVNPEWTQVFISCCVWFFNSKQPRPKLPLLLPRPLVSPRAPEPAVLIRAEGLVWAAGLGRMSSSAAPSSAAPPPAFCGGSRAGRPRDCVNACTSFILPPLPTSISVHPQFCPRINHPLHEDGNVEATQVNVFGAFETHLSTGKNGIPVGAELLVSYGAWYSQVLQLAGHF